MENEVFEEFVQNFLNKDSNDVEMGMSPEESQRALQELNNQKRKRAEE